MLTCFPGSALLFSFISPTNWYSIDEFSETVFLPFYQVSLNITTLVLSRLCSIHTSELTYFRDSEKSAMPSYFAYNWRVSW